MYSNSGIFVINIILVLNDASCIGVTLLEYDTNLSDLCLDIIVLSFDLQAKKFSDISIFANVSQISQIIL